MMFFMKTASKKMRLLRGFFKPSPGMRLFPLLQPLLKTHNTTIWWCSYGNTSNPQRSFRNKKQSQNLPIFSSVKQRFQRVCACMQENTCARKLHEWKHARCFHSHTFKKHTKQHFYKIALKDASPLLAEQQKKANFPNTRIACLIAVYFLTASSEAVGTCSLEEALTLRKQPIPTSSPRLLKYKATHRTPQEEPSHPSQFNSFASEHDQRP